MEDTKPSTATLISKVGSKHVLGLFSQISCRFNSSKATKTICCKYNYHSRKRAVSMIRIYAKVAYERERWEQANQKV